MESRITKGYAILAVLYAFMLVTSNIIAGKIFAVGGILLPAAVIIYPCVYIISDLMTEVYGFRLSLLSIRLNTLCSLLFVGVVAVVLRLPYPDFWTNQGAFVGVFRTTPRIVLASLAGYYLGDWLNSATLSIMKVRVRRGGFPLRAILSTMLGQVADTGLFIFIAFFGTMPTGVLLQMMLAQYMVKVGYEAVCTPLTAYIVARWKEWDGVDQYDVGNARSLYRIV